MTLVAWILSSSLILLAFYIPRLRRVNRLWNQLLFSSITVPIVGPILALFDGERLSALLHKCSHDNVPTRLRVLGSSIFVVSRPSDVQLLFKGATNLTFAAMKARILGNVFGLPRIVRELYRTDDSGVAPRPRDSGPSIDPRTRIRRMERQIIHDSLSPASTAALGNEYLHKIISAFESRTDIKADSWSEIADLWSFTKESMFPVIVDCLYGPELLSNQPGFASQFFDFDRYIHVLSKGIPRFWSLRAYATRDRCLGTVRKWRHELLLRTPVEEESKNWSSRFFDRRCDLYGSVIHMDADACASFDFAFVWAANANLIPATFWLLYSVIRSEDLMRRVLREVENLNIRRPRDLLQSTILRRVESSTLLEALFTETLRSYVSFLIVRNVEHSPFQLAGTKIQPGEYIIASTQVLHNNITTWDRGGFEKDIIPLEDFHVDRFLEKQPSKRPAGEMDAAEYPKERVKREEEHFTMDGLAGAWIPFGGGASMCPGRHLARRIMIVHLITFLLSFEVGMAHLDRKLEPDMERYGFGVLQPKRGDRVPLCIKKRDL